MRFWSGVMPRVVGALLFVSVGTILAQQKGNAGEPEFALYSVAPSFIGQAARPVFSTSESRSFRTRIRQGIAKGPVFADHYAVAVWGCGSGCISFAIIDLVSGVIFMFPATVSMLDEAGEQLTYRRNSRAMHVVGSLNEKDSADRWFLWDGKKLKLISRKPAHLLNGTDEPSPYEAI